MRYFFTFVFVICIFININNISLALPFQGGVEKEIVVGKSKVIDSKTGEAIVGAKVSMPLENEVTYSNNDGIFNLNANLNGQTVLLVEKEGYKPYSVTVDKNDLASPIILSLEKATVKDIVLDSDLFHLGDDNFSTQSANASQFQIASMGSFYTKNFKLGRIPQGARVNLVLGSVMGVDTKLAKEMGQNKIVGTYASAPQIYFNGNKIAEIQLNGDGQRVRIPNNLIRPNQNNQITIKTGVNLMQKAYVDYDDIELANISIETN